MRKVLTQKTLSQRPISRALLAISLSATVAAIGCTTNMNPGAGTPTRSGSEVRTAPTAGVTSGSEQTPPLPPPMTSSSRGFDALPINNAMSASDNAAAVMASHQRVRVLGPVSPGPHAYGGAIPVAGAGAGYPALITNPQVTINSSISSPATSAISTGADGTNGTAFVTVGGTTANVIVPGTTNSINTASGAAVFTPATAALSATPGTFAGVAPNATIASGAAISPTAARSPLVTTTATTLGTTTTSNSTANTMTLTGTSTANARISRLRSTGVTTANPATTVNGVRVMSANGRVTVTNVGQQQK